MASFIGALIFLTVFLLTQSMYHLYRQHQLHSFQRIRKRLDVALDDQEPPLEREAGGLLKSRSGGDSPTLQQLLSRSRIFAGLERLLTQANVSWTASRFLLASLLLGATAGLAAHLLLGRGLALDLIAAVAAAGLPIVVLRRKKRERERLFAEQLPDVLDLMTRALRAGHAMPAAIQFAGQESPSPSGPEFRRVFEEVNFGMDIPAALINLSKRIDCYDLRYIVTAITIHREIGGNLGELFDRLSNLIRERFKLIGQTRALTAQGRMSGHVLIALPLVMAGVLYVIQPKYLSLLLTDRLGVIMVVGALVMQLLGYLVIRKIVNIEPL